MEEPAANPKYNPRAITGIAAARHLVENRIAHVERERARLDAIQKAGELSWRSLSVESKAALLYLLFLGVFCCAIFGPISSDSYFMNRQVQNLFFDAEFDYKISYYEVNTPALWYQWMETQFIPNWLQDYPSNYTSAAVSAETTMVAALGQDYLPDGINVRIGRARLRVLRVRNDSCVVAPVFQERVSECYGAFSTSNMATDNHTDLPFRKDLGMPSLSSIDTGISYPGYGHVVDMPHDRNATLALLESLKAAEFIDLSVRGVFVDFTMYNPSTDLFAVVTASMEFLETGVGMPSTIIRVQPLLRSHRIYAGEASHRDTAWASMELICFALVFLYIGNFIRRYKAAPDKALWVFGDAWHMMDLMNYMCFLVVIALRFTTVAEIEALSTKWDDRDIYQNFVSTADLFFYLNSVNAFNTVLCFIKVFKYTHTNKQLGQFTDTLIVAYSDMVVLTIIIFIVCIGYGLAFTLAFGTWLSAYRNFTESLLSLFQSVLGVLQIDELSEVRPSIGLALIISFIILMFLIIVSMFLATVDKAYEAVRHALEDLSGHIDPLATDLKRVQGGIVRMMLLFEQVFSEDPDARRRAREARANEALNKLRELKRKEAEEKVLGLGAQASDPLLDVLGLDGLKMVQMQLYKLELAQAELGMQLAKLSLRVDTANRFYPLVE